MTLFSQSIPCVCGNLTCTIPYGKCHCGCGRSTSIATQTHTKNGYVKGRPIKFVVGHSGAARGKARQPISYGIMDGRNVTFVPLTRNMVAIVDQGVELRFPGIWSVGEGGYVSRYDTAIKKSIKLHHLLVGDTKGMLVDHINGNPLDNRMNNLRLVTASQNAMNHKLRSTNRSGVKGVMWDKSWKRWVANITVNRNVIFLGSSKVFKRAVAMRKAAERQYHGEFARKS